MKKKVISYQRFSSRDQSKGDSLYRQTKAFRRYITANPDLEPFEIIEDKAVSAFKGKNADEGNLSELIKKFESGEINGNEVILFIEAMHRLTRLEPLSAMALFGNILNLGVEIHTQAGGHYSKRVIKNNPQALLQAVAEIIMAHEKSQTISDHVREKKEGLRNRILAGEKNLIFTKMTPAWISVENDRFCKNENAKTVSYIFKWYNEGKGYGSICKLLEEKRIPTFKGKKNWNSSRIRQILTTESVTGDFTFHKYSESGERIPVGDKVEGYFPEVVSRADFNRAQVRLSTTKKGRRSVIDPTRNLFRSMLKCSECGTTLYVRRKSTPKKKKKVTYQIEGEHRSCPARHVISYEYFEEQFLSAFLWRLKDFNPYKTDDILEKELKEKRNELTLNEQQQAKLNQQLKDLNGVLPIESAKALVQFEKSAPVLRKEIKVLSEELKGTVSSGKTKYHEWKERMERYSSMDLGKDSVREKLALHLSESINEIRISSIKTQKGIRKTDKNRAVQTLRLYQVEVFLNNGRLLDYSIFESRNRKTKDFDILEPNPFTSVEYDPVENSADFYKW